MNITLICVGKLSEKYLKDGVEEYKKRLSKFTKLEIIELEDLSGASVSQKEEENLKEKEAQKMLQYIKPTSFLICLDIIGKQYDSIALASKIQDYMNQGNSHFTFIIGGSCGISKQLLDMANLRLSLSKMTFTHQMTRLVLLEQIYRCFKILNNETYHK